VSVENGRIFLEAWISGVRRHYPGEPGYVASWQQETDADIFEVIERSATGALHGRG
jgi:hypothetical protein